MYFCLVGPRTILFPSDVKGIHLHASFAGQYGTSIFSSWFYVCKDPCSLWCSYSGKWCSYVTVRNWKLTRFCYRTLNLDTKTTQQRRKGEAGDFQMLEKNLTWKGSIFKRGSSSYFRLRCKEACVKFWDCSLLLLILGKFPNDTLLWQTETQELSINQNGTRFFKGWKKTKLFYSQDLSSNSSYCLLYNSHDVSSEIWYWINPQSPDRDFLFTHFFYAWYCIDILKRKSVLVIHGSERLQHGLQMINLKNLRLSFS